MITNPSWIRANNLGQSFNRLHQEQIFEEIFLIFPSEGISPSEQWSLTRGAQTPLESVSQFQAGCESLAKAGISYICFSFNEIKVK